MNKTVRFVLPVFLTALAVVAAAPLLTSQSESETSPDEQQTKPAPISAGDTVYLTRSESLRKTPFPTGSTLTKLNRRHPVEVREVRDDWIQVQVEDQTGWLPASALSADQPSAPDEEPSYEEQKKRFLNTYKSYRNQSGSGSTATRPTARNQQIGTAAGTRGLNPENEENYEKVDGDFEQLKQMETLSRFLSSDEQLDTRKQFAEEKPLHWTFNREASQ